MGNEVRRSTVQVFESKEARDRWQIQEYGQVRNGFRTHGEPPDGRPLLIEPDAFWEDYTEQLAYEAAVEANPKRDGEGLLTYLERIVAEVKGRYEKAGQPFPRPTTRRQREAKLAELRTQAKRMALEDVRLPYAESDR
jgi:hypothetical protein